MADSYIQDSELLKQLNEGYVADPAILEALNAPQTVMEKLTTPKSAWETFTSPTTPEDFSMKDVGVEGAIGAGIGAALGAPTLIGVPAATLTGGILGLTSGLAGETSRAMGNSPATTLAAETLAGLGIQGAGIATKGIAKLLPWKGRVISNLLPGNLEANASKIVGEKMFGKDTYGVLHTTENSEATQNALKQELFGNDINVLDNLSNEKVSNILRNDFYNSVKDLKEQTLNITNPIEKVTNLFSKRIAPPVATTSKLPNVFSVSPEYKALMTDISALAERDRMSPAEIKSLQTILRNELSKNPIIADTAHQDVLNLLQNGGIYTIAKKGAEVETKTKIPEEARTALVKRFDQYLERNVGEKQYSILKNAEKQEFIAEARDAIPTLINENFRLGSPEFTKAISLIEQSPTGKQEVINAFNQHLKSLDNPEDMKKAYNSIAPKLRALKILDRQTSSNISQKIAAIPKGVSDLVRNQTIKNLLIFPAISTATSEVVGNDKINPLKAFSY
ncbi:hypothetical protein UFOVP22_13 [uncultured Caudovirales phage]|uniref:Uncharacterized protein n=1 Tax=uncultured Caudovirales phage TaxID=2100421 RepID=A0A6J5T7T1_9CAUD|nr:hypothetical protein UFOVP22_13 [uncultured Caudovirales phage]